MKAWIYRSREIRNLYNPAFCGEAIFRGILSYNSSTKSSMPYSLAILLLPFVLHKSTREAILRGNVSYLTKIIGANPEILIGFPARVRGLMPYSLEAIGLLFQYGTIEIDECGGLTAIEGSIRKSIKGTEECRACQKASVTVGKKFAEANDRVTIYMNLGIRP